MAARVLLLLGLLATVALADQSVMQQLPSSQFSGFMKLCEHADLIPELEAALKAGNGATVFAPTDDALMYHTSPTLLAYLKLAENKETLRKVLRSHIVAKRLSPFQWEGAHQTLEGSELPLSMDAQAFYAGNVAVMQYNAVVGSDGAVHSVPTLILPQGLGDAAAFVEQGTEIRRNLMGAAAPAPSMGPTAPSTPAPPAPNAAPRAVVASIVTVAVAALTAMVL